MKNKKSIFKDIFTLFVIFLLSVSFTLTVSYIILQYFEFKERKRVIQEKFLNDKKTLVKKEVERVKELIKYGIENHISSLKMILKKKSGEIFNLIDNQYRKMKKSNVNLIPTSLKAISDKIIEISIIDSNGNIVYSSEPELQMHNIFNKDNNIIRKKSYELLKNILRLSYSSDSGYYTYRGLSRGDSGISNYSLVYFRNYKPGGLVIITRIRDMKIRKLQDSLIRRISKIRFNKEGYIFINKIDGISLVSNGKVLSEGKKLWEIFGEDARNVFNMELNAVKRGGDFIYYTWSKLSSNKKKYPKLSYVTAFPEWGWIIGGGIYLDDIQKEIAVLQKSLTNKIFTYLLAAVFITLLVLLLTIFAIKKLFYNLESDFKIFVSFFKKAAFTNKKIDRKGIKFEELSALADYANKMVDDKMAIQKTLFEESERLEITLESIGDAVITVDNDGKIIMLNRMAEILTGYKKSEILGKDSKNIFSFIDKEGKKSISFFEYMNNAKKYEELQLVSNDGVRYIIEDSVSEIKDFNGNKRGIVFVFRDVTEKIKNREEINKAKKLESLGILAGGIAHDFNNLLTGVYGYISLAKMFLKSEHKSYTFLEEAEKSIDKATSLTKQLLTFSKGGTPVKKVINIKKLVLEVARFCLRGSNIVLKDEIDENLWEIRADKDQISQVISNIVINAKQAIAEKGEIFIRIRNFENRKTNIKLKSGYYILISITDNGKGIEKGIIGKIFDPYFTTKKDGTGLGLTICYSIIKRHEGVIKVESEPGRGSTFNIYLPAVGKVNKDTDKADDLHHNLRLKSFRENIRVLIMDDEKVVRDIGKAIMEEMGISVETAKNGEEAIQKYKDSMKSNEKFDVVVMDLTVVGGMGGKEAVKILLKIDPEAKVIVSSGYSTDPVMANFQNYGFKGAIPKPFTIENLRITLIKVLESN